MGLFGEIDADDVVTEWNDTHLCKISIETFKNKQDPKALNVKVTYEAIDPDSPNYGEEHVETPWFRMFPGYDQEDFSSLPKDSEDWKETTQVVVKKHVKKLSARLASLGVPKAEYNAKDFDPDGLEFTAEVAFKTSEDKNGREWININKITLIEDAPLSDEDEDEPAF